jgi:deoxycytidylate deaminase
VASGLPHCTDKPCKGASLPSGTGLNLCEAIHAEANALISCRDPEDIYAAYCSASPCVHCVRMLMNTPCVRIVFTEEYPHPESRDLWLGRPDREWLHIPRG